MIFITRLIAGNFPEYKQLIPTPRLKLQVLAPVLERAVRRLGDIAKDSSGIVRLKWTETQMSVSAKSDEVGEVEATIPVSAEDGPGRIGIDVKVPARVPGGQGERRHHGRINR